MVRHESISVSFQGKLNHLATDAKSCRVTKLHSLGKANKTQRGRHRKVEKVAQRNPPNHAALEL
ncbi:hypothetical protein PGTUg99_026707 [Puccinia graminis f. sp. tritici]|uniref:Uncharacterized protein n=1 Tax=Puccinia graminis f. sp. tritici TaxID=56615 RepID=A0A5B0RDI4_PUCGR|nr:hypothetical protein PGTUg99_026707 [Puccinia graminis f. sp. tritici]